MANPHTGEVEVGVDGKTLKLSFSSNALCELEDALDRNVNEIADAMQDPKRIRLKDLRMMFWAALLDHQPATTHDDVKAMLRTVGPSELVDMIGKAFVLAFPQAKEGEASAAPAESPQTPGEPAAVGTGSVS